MKLCRSDWVILAFLWLIIPLHYIREGQDVNWDLQNYHLYNTISLFEGSFLNDTAPAAIQSYFNPLVSLPAYWIHRLAASPVLRFGAGLALASFQGICGPLLYGIARTLLPFPRSMAALASGLGITSPILLSEAGTSFADLTLCVLQLGSVLICLRSLGIASPRNSHLLAISWGMFGSACGLKFSSIFVVPLLMMLSMSSLFIMNKKSMPVLKGLGQTCLFIILPALIGFLLFGWLWMSRSWADNGNPFFPLFSDLFGQSRLFFTDNHADTRFIPDDLRKLLLAPIDDLRFNPSSRRAEVPYQDLRTLLWVFGGIFSLSIWAALNHLTKSLGTQIRLACLPKGWLPMQLGLLLSYPIWLKAAGIARYSLPIQAMSGISLLISLAILGQVLSALSQQNAYAVGSANTTPRLVRRPIYIIFIILAILCLFAQKTPSWGRIDFQSTWNSLRPVDSAGQPLPGTTWVEEGKLFPADRPIVLMSTPLAWLKQYAPTHPTFHLVSPNLRPMPIAHIMAVIRQSGSRLTAVDFVTNSPNALAADRTIVIGEGRMHFRTSDCQDYGTGSGLRIRICSAQLLQPAS